MSDGSPRRARPDLAAIPPVHDRGAGGAAVGPSALPVVDIVVTSRRGRPDEVTVDGAAREVPEGGCGEDAGVDAAVEIARGRGGPVLAVLHDPPRSWEWQLVVHPDGVVTELGGGEPAEGRWCPRPRVVLLVVVAVAVLAAAVAAAGWGGQFTQAVVGAAFAAPDPVAASSTPATPSGAPTPAVAGTAGSGSAGGPATAPGGGCPGAAARQVSDVIDPAQWYLTLPTGTPGRPDTVKAARLAAFTGPAFHLDPRGGLLLRATAGGVTTAHSDYPRSELREVDRGKLAAWSDTAGTHTLQVCQAVTELPPVTPHVVVAQIHDTRSDVMEVRLEGAELLVRFAEGKKAFTLDPAYRLGTPYRLRIVAGGGRVVVFYNDRRAASIDQTGTGWYFKTGAYLQSNTAHGDAVDAGATVALFSATARHDPPLPGGAA